MIPGGGIVLEKPVPDEFAGEVKLFPNRTNPRFGSYRKNRNPGMISVEGVPFSGTSRHIFSALRRDRSAPRMMHIMSLFAGKSSNSKRKPNRGSRHFFGSSVIERLGDRILPATYVVQTTSDVVGGTVEIKYIGNDTYEVPMLRTAIEQANANGGTDTIQFAEAILGQTITLMANDAYYPTDLGQTALVVTDSVVIQGYSQSTGTKGITIDGAGQRRIFGIGDNVIFTLVDVTLTGGYAQNASGAPAFYGAAGGGGAGMGGAIFGYGARINLTNVTITNSSAQGGAGGSMDTDGGYAGGGGGSAAFPGGLGGFTDDAFVYYGGGGGGGMNGPGQNANANAGGPGGLNQNG